MLRTHAHDAAVVVESGPKSAIIQAIPPTAVQNETPKLLHIGSGFSASAEIVLDTQTHRGTPVKTIIAFYCSFLFLAQARAVTPLTSPTLEQVDPYLNCLNEPVWSTSATGLQDGYLVGKASFTRFICKMDAHTGRGGGIRIFSGCANVTGDLSGLLVTATYRDVVPNYYLPADCQ